MSSSATLLLSTKPINIPKPSLSAHHHHHNLHKPHKIGAFNSKPHDLLPSHHLNGPATSSTTAITTCHASPRNTPSVQVERGGGTGDDENVRRVVRIALWVLEGVYIFWLFLLPYAPGDPVWAISKDTVDSLIGLSLNFFFILPLLNSGMFILVLFLPCFISLLFPNTHAIHWGSLRRAVVQECNTYDSYTEFWNFQSTSCFSRCFGVVGIHILEAPVLHPASEGLFNFVIGWTFMFAPLLFTDSKRDRYKWSLDALWGFQMFLTNTFLIPYMAIRLNEADSNDTPRERSQLGTLMTNGAPNVGVIGAAACAITILWAIYGRMDGGFGNITERWEFLVEYLRTERLAYAFIWDIVLYTIFQPWLVGDNLQNVEKSKVGLVNYLRFVPVIGLLAYLLCLDLDEAQ